MSEAILRLVRLAREAGLEPEEGEWTDSFVYWFNAFRPGDIRVAGNADSSLDYFDSEGTPHNPAGEGFIDRDARTAMSFLLEMRA